MMDWGIVVAALVTAVGGIITSLLMLVRKENTEDHAKVVGALEVLSGNVQSIGTKLDAHIDWHLKETTNGEVPTRNQSTRTQRRIKN
jgi:hypothetical protein